MRDQVHIRNAEAAHLARTLAKETGKTISEVVLDALRSYRPKPAIQDRRRLKERWQRLLEKDRKGFDPKREVAIDDLYDPHTGLPK
jgi:hypothetical protein